MSVLAGLLMFPLAKSVAQPSELTESPQTSYAFLGKQLDQKIADLDWGDNAKFSFCVMDLENNLPVYAREADLPLPPGSPIKLYSAYAALEKMGPDFRFATSFHVEGWIAKRKLKGDFFKTKLLEGRITIVGGGDPTLSFDFAGSPDPVFAILDTWIKPMAEAGVEAFAGEIVVDATLFPDSTQSTGWPEARSALPAYAEVSALNFNDNCVDIHWDTKKIREGKIAPYIMTPSLPKMILLSNNVKVQRTTMPSREYERAPDSNVIKVAGKIPPDTQLHDRVAIARASRFFGEVFAQRLEVNDIKLFGSVREGKLEPLPTSASGTETGLIPFTIQDTLQSPKLEQIVHAMLRDDRTVDAEVIVKTLGLRNGSAATTEAGTAIMMKHLRDSRVSTSGLALMDGSGNSEMNRVSARHLMSLMSAIRLSPNQERILGALAQNGQPGDLANRFLVGVDPETQNPIEVRGIAGGTTSGASLVGWTLTRARRPIYFALIISGSSLSTEELNQRLDAVVMEIARSFIK